MARKKRRGASLAHLEHLAAPRPRYRNFIPDKPSPYWLDFLLDPTPHYIRDPTELLQYYVKSSENFKRLESLTKSKLNIETSESARPVTAFGNSICI